MLNTFSPGLKGVIAAQTRLSHIDGERGQLTIGGCSLDDLAPNATYEEALYLLLNDRLPTAAQLADFRAELAALRHLPEVTLAVIREAVGRGDAIMDVLRAAAATLPTTGDPRTDGLRAAAAFPLIVGGAWRVRQGHDPLAQVAAGGHAAACLAALTGTDPSPAAQRALETYLITVIDHGLNASTFTARVIASTGSDLISAVVGAVGALKGPLHGGAPGPALQLVREIGSAERAEPVLRAMFERGELLMGFGHRVYRVRDPRADVLGAEAERLFTTDGDRALYDLARHVEAVALRLFEEYKPGRRIQTNVEFYTALLLNGLRLDPDLFAPTFAVGRAGGWVAHALEQIAAGKIIRPTSEYTGETNRPWIPLEERTPSA
ncbi:MAG: citrate synthase [Anaerolineae bacterium]